VRNTPRITLPDTDLLTPGEVARAFHVDPKTLIRWRKAGRLSFLVTPGGTHRFFRSEIDALINGPEAGK
jgi:predicted site-specific integrase-resolvase